MNRSSKDSASNLFNRYIWLIDIIYRAGKITFEEINERWSRSQLNIDGNDLPLRTFHNHRQAIEEMFDINIECDKRNGYKYYIENAEDMERGGIRNWLLNTFAVNNLINESHQLKHRILFEDIPSGRKYLTFMIEAMRDNQTIEITYQSYWQEKPHTCEIEPYCIKVFRQRWYALARNTSLQAYRIYALDRIQHLRITDHSFHYPDDFDPERFFHHSFGIIVDDYDSEQILIKVYGTKRKYLRALPLHHSQQEVESTDTYSIFQYLLRPSYDFQQEIFSHANEVEVLKPEWFRTEVAHIVQLMNEHYQ